MSGRLLAISDLHVNHRGNLDALAALPQHPGDWLLVPGDVGDAPEHLEAGLDVLIDRFERVIWAPGNHELWVARGDGPRGVNRYEVLLEICQRHGVLTPEDPFPIWSGDGGPARIAPMFVGYDWSFRPAHVSLAGLADWAAEDGIHATDDRVLRADPYKDVAEWCAARVALTRARLEAASDLPLVLMNHYPLRQDLVRLFRIARYAPWCGTTATEDWHTRFPARVVVSGHLHMRATDWRDGVRFEEVSLGYPRHWRAARGVEWYLREILPGIEQPIGVEGPIWRF